MNHISLMPHLARGQVTKEGDAGEREHKPSILKLLAAQIMLHKRMEDHLYNRVRPEIEFILSNDPWRERGG